MDKDSKTKTKNEDLEVTYDEKKLHRFLQAFNSLYELQVGTLKYIDVDEYLCMDVIMETFHESFFKHLVKNDKTVLPYVLLMELLDILNGVEINFEAEQYEDFLGPVNIENLPLPLITVFPHYYRTSNPETHEDILKYFISKVDLENYNNEILYLITLIMSGVFFDNAESDYYLPAAEKLLKAISKFNSEEMSADFHEVFSKILAHYIKVHITHEVPVKKILERVDNVKHLYGAYGPVISFLTANDELDQAYEYITHILDEGLANPKLAEIYEGGIIIGLQSFLYVSLCFDKMNYFKELFPEFLKFPIQKDDVKILLLLYKKCTSPEDYEEYMKKLNNNDEITAKSKKELKRFYLKNMTSSN